MASTTSVLQRWTRAAVVAGLLVPLGACFNYSDVPLESVAPNQTARVTLDQDGFGRVVNEAAVGGFPVQSMNLSNNRVSGRVADIGDDGLTLELRGAGGLLFTTRVARRSIQNVAVREFDRSNTLLTAGGVVAIAFGMLKGRTSGGATGEPAPPDPENMIGLRLFSISVP